MIKEIIFKRQAKSKDINGDVPAKDSWWIYYTDPERIPELVFEDPSIEKGIDMSKVDISTMTPKQLTELKTALGL